MDVFCVVEFLAEGALEVVPRSWIDDDLKHCFYKSDPSVAKLRKDLRSKPSADWPKYEIKIRYQHKDYRVAAKACDQLQFTSNLDSSDSSGSEVDLSRKSRKRKPRKPYSPSFHLNKIQKKSRRPVADKVNAKELLFPSETKSIPNSSQSPPLSPLFSTPPVTFEANKEVPCGPSDYTSEIVSNFGPNLSLELDQLQQFQTSATDFENPQTLTLSQIPSSEQVYLELDNSNSISVADSSISGSGSSSYGGQSLILTPCSTPSLPSPSLASETLSEIRRFQQVVLRELGYIKEEVRIIKSSVKRGEGSWSSPVQVPFSSESDLNSAESLLSSEATRSAFQSWCELIGGSDYKHHVRRALSRLFTHEFSLLVNMSGISSKGKKLPFASTSVCKILMNAISKSINVKEDLVEKSVGKWFRGSSDRNGGRSERKH